MTDRRIHLSTPDSEEAVRRYDITTFSDTETVEIEAQDLTLEQRLDLMCGRCPYASEPEPCGDYEPLNASEKPLEEP